MLKWPAASHRPHAARFLPAALTTSLITLLGCGSEGPAAPADNPVVVQSITLTPDTATVAIGQPLTLTAHIAAEGALLGPALMHWSAAPSVPLSVAPSGLTADLTADHPGAYEITVQAAGKTAHATVTVLGFPLDSPLLGQWRLTALWLRADDGAEPEPVPFDSGALIVTTGRLAFTELSPKAASSDSGSLSLDYPYSYSVNGSKLFLCWERDPYSCTTAQATVTPDGTRLSIVGPPRTGFFFPPDTLKYGTPEWEFQR